MLAPDHPRELEGLRGRVVLDTGRHGDVLPLQETLRLRLLHGCLGQGRPAALPRGKRTDPGDAVGGLDPGRPSRPQA
eukprot:11166121-Lingulodinium_polyedra.AAC.1